MEIKGLELLGRKFKLPPVLQMQRAMELRGRQKRAGGAGSYATPNRSAGAGRGHHLAHWRLAGRQDLVVRAMALGVLVKGKTPDIIGKPGRGQFRTWKALAAAVQRAERLDTQTAQDAGVPA